MVCALAEIVGYISHELMRRRGRRGSLMKLGGGKTRRTRGQHERERCIRFPRKESEERLIIEPTSQTSTSTTNFDLHLNSSVLTASSATLLSSSVSTTSTIDPSCIHRYPIIFSNSPRSPTNVAMSENSSERREER